MKFLETLKGYSIINIESLNKNKVEIMLKDDRGFIIIFDAVINNLRTYIE